MISRIQLIHFSRTIEMLMITEKTVVQLTIDDYKTATILQFQASKRKNA